MQVHRELAESVVPGGIAFDRGGEDAPERLHVSGKPGDDKLCSFLNTRYRGPHSDACRIERRSRDPRWTAREPHRHEDYRDGRHSVDHDHVPFGSQLLRNPELELVSVVIERSPHGKVSVERWPRKRINSSDERVHESGYDTVL